MIVKAHTSIIGDTGYNCHSRNFFKALHKITPVQVRNFTVGSSWEGYNNDEPHNKEYYIDDVLKTMLVDQTLNTPNGDTEFPLYRNYKNEGNPDVHIVLNDNTHHYFKQNYSGKKIAYNVWETTRQPLEFFENLKKFDEVWVPSKWQRQCTIEQGISADKVKVVPEGVDVNTYKPKNRLVSKPLDRPFRFILVGRWEYRKSTREIIQTFVNTFSEDQNVELLINVDNQFATDGLNSTEERLEKFGISHKGIKILHHLSKEEYVKTLKSADVFLSCARGEGWNLPLIEAMSCGIPSMYSDWGAQLEFANGRGIPVKIKGEVPAAVQNEESWNPNTPGNFAEPDFEDLSQQMLDVFENYTIHKRKALNDSDEIREIFTWKNAANIAKAFIDELVETPVVEEKFAFVTCGNIGYMPLVEKLVKSLLEFSNQKIIVYGIGCDVPFDYPNLIKRRMEIPYYSEHDKWYWKQYACLESLNEDFENYIWIDGDVVANYNIDNFLNYFQMIDNYPIPDIHLQTEFIGYYKDINGNNGRQVFNETLCNKHGVERFLPFAHICMYIYNKECKWWFDEILNVYMSTPLDEYPMLLQWNDEGIDNFLRFKYKFNKFLPVSNFDVSEWDGDLLGTTGESMKHFLTFWNEEGPKNFGKIYGWQYVPKDKSNILYFHGNKNLEFAEIMTDFIKSKRDNNFFDTKYFYVDNYKIKNLGSIEGIEGGTMDIAYKFGWDYAIFHEVYNLKDYERFGQVGIQEGDVVVDLGGNMGIFTRYAYQKGASKIVTFEPDRRYFQILKKNAPENAILFNAAIGDKIGKLTLTESEHLGGSNLWHPKDPAVNQYEVNVYKLDYILKHKLIDRIDFLKVDIEGSEIIALQGISDENLSKIRNIAVEYHHEHLKFDEELRNKFVSRLNNLGFNSHVLFCGTDNALQLIYFWK
jgi:FkbM family methyltransferase